MSTGLDAAHISLAHFKLYAEGVEEYRCDGRYTLGINTQYFHRYLKNLSVSLWGGLCIPGRLFPRT